MKAIALNGRETPVLIENVTIAPNPNLLDLLSTFVSNKIIFRLFLTMQELRKLKLKNKWKN
jgi:hypothetical protein